MEFAILSSVIAGLVPATHNLGLRQRVDTARVDGRDKRGHDGSAGRNRSTNLSSHLHIPRLAAESGEDHDGERRREGNARQR